MLSRKLNMVLCIADYGDSEASLLPMELIQAALVRLSQHDDVTLSQVLALRTIASDLRQPLADLVTTLLAEGGELSPRSWETFRKATAVHVRKVPQEPTVPPRLDLIDYERLINLLGSLPARLISLCIDAYRPTDLLNPQLCNILVQALFAMRCSAKLQHLKLTEPLDPAARTALGAGLSSLYNLKSLEVEDLCLDLVSNPTLQLTTLTRLVTMDVFELRGQQQGALARAFPHLQELHIRGNSSTLQHITAALRGLTSLHTLSAQGLLHPEQDWQPVLGTLRCLTRLELLVWDDPHNDAVGDQVACSMVADAGQCASLVELVLGLGSNAVSVAAVEALAAGACQGLSRLVFEEGSVYPHVLLRLLDMPAAGAGAGEGDAQPMEVEQAAGAAAAPAAAEQVLRPLPALHTVHVSWPCRDLASWLNWLRNNAADAADVQQLRQLLQQLASPAALALVQAVFEAVCTRAGDTGRLDNDMLRMMAGQAFDRGAADVLQRMAAVLALGDLPSRAEAALVLGRLSQMMALSGQVDMVADHKGLPKEGAVVEWGGRKLVVGAAAAVEY